MGNCNIGIYSLGVMGRNLALIKAGKPVDLVIDEFTNFLNPGDIFIDNGNSNFNDTNQRVNRLQKKGVQFVRMEISGGDEGARNGPSVMPGGITGWLSSSTGTDSRKTKDCFPLSPIRQELIHKPVKTF